MQGGLASDTAPHEYGATTAGQPSASSTSSTTQGESRIAEWLSSLNLSSEDVFLLSAILNVLAAGAMLLTGVFA